MATDGSDADPGVGKGLKKDRRRQSREVLFTPCNRRNNQPSPLLYKMYLLSGNPSSHAVEAYKDSGEAMRSKSMGSLGAAQYGAGAALHATKPELQALAAHNESPNGNYAFFFRAIRFT